MRAALRVVQVALVAALLAAFSVSLMQAKVEYTKKEGKPCTSCHVKANSKELNDVGKCYEKKKSLKDCAPPEKKQG